jgi:hypothetical protein
MDIDATVRSIWNGLMRVKCLRETALPIAEMQRTLALIEAKIVQYRSQISEQSAPSKEHVSSSGRKHNG